MVRSSQKKRRLCHFFPASTKTRTKQILRPLPRDHEQCSQSSWDVQEHCPVLVSQVPPLKLPAEELLTLPLLCSTSCFILKHNSASLPHCNALCNLRIKLFAIHKHAGSINMPTKHQESDETQNVHTQTRLTSLWPSGKHSCQELLTLLSLLCIECFSWKYSHL